MEQEEWKDIEISNGAYSVSNMGQVRSNDRIASDGRKIKGRILRQYRIKPRGYKVVALRIGGKTIKFLVHRLVYCTFNNLDIYIDLDVDHNDNDPDHNWLENLSGLTRSENIQKSYECRRTCEGYEVPHYFVLDRVEPSKANCKRIAQLNLNNEIIAKYESLVEAEERTGISRNNISRCLRGIFQNSGGYKWAYLE